MKPVIAIPSYNNPNRIGLRRVSQTGLQVYLFIRKEQLPMYENYKSLGYKIILLRGVEEIGKTRALMMRYFNSKGIDWVFMFDDDIQKVEILSQTEQGKWNSDRILTHPQDSPSIESKALKIWYRLAKKNNLSLSSPNHRAYDRSNHGLNIRVNKSACIQCILLHVPDVVSVGNYKHTMLTGVEDYYIQYALMANGYKVGKIGCVEYDCPTMGNIHDGTNQAFIDKYKRYVNTFKSNVCDDPKLIGVKTTSSGVPSIKFLWKNWGGYDIPIPHSEYEKFLEG